jgi:hypothetical protein
VARKFKRRGKHVLTMDSIAMPGKKLATSKNPRMLTPSEVDLLRHDLGVALSVVGQDEIDDAVQLVHEFGLSSDDFEFVPTVGVIPISPGPIVGTVEVRHKHGQKIRKYSAGHASAWLQEFERDLERQYFGPTSN